MKLKYHSTDSGFCRVYYKSEKGGFYCFQKISRRFNLHEFFVCSKDGEPDIPLATKSIESVELPPDNGCEINAEVRDFIERKIHNAAKKTSV
jgi:hypothetical protein